MTELGSRRPWLTRNVVMLGFVSLLTDTASEVIVPLLPFFLASTLGAGALALGWIEGLADATASVLKLLSGRWADRLGRNRPLVLAGYLLYAAMLVAIGVLGGPIYDFSVRAAENLLHPTAYLAAVNGP